MDNALTLVRHFARLVWLLVNDAEAVHEQKGALRAATLVAKSSPVRLGAEEGHLTVNGLVMPHALAGVPELAQRMQSGGIDEIDIVQEAKPAELLALARLLATGDASAPNAVEFRRRVAELKSETVHVRLTPAPDGQSLAEPAPPNERSDQSQTPADRIKHLLSQLATPTDATSSAGRISELAFAAEQAGREGRNAEMAELFSELIRLEADATTPDLQHAYAMSVRRLSKPAILRPVAQMLAEGSTGTGQFERILRRCGQDGVDAVVDLFANAGSRAARTVCRNLLAQLPSASEALILMLDDQRWYVVRQATELLITMRVSDADRALAELLRHADERVRRAATRALGRLDTSFAVDAIGRSLGDAVQSVRLEAVAGLVARKGLRAGSLLGAALDGENDVEVQHAIVAALGRVATPDAVQKLISTAVASGLFKQKKNMSLRVAAILALGDARTPAAQAALKGLANDREREVRDAVARALSMPRSTAA
jgi:hypothetical protein